MVSLQAIAQQHPELIEDAITDNGNGTYTVRLYKDGEAFYVTVTDDLPMTEDGVPAFGRGALSATADGYAGELWPAIMEKAMAAYEGGYGNMESKSAAEALDTLTGKDSQTKTDYSAQELQDVLKNGGVVVASTKDRPKGDYDPTNYPDPMYRKGAESQGRPLSSPLVYNHGYSVKSVELGQPNDSSDDTVTLVNPQEPEKETVMSFDDFHDSVMGVTENSVK